MKDNKKERYSFICKKCGKEYTLELTKQEFIKHVYSDYCSIYCARSRTHSVKTKNKISESLKVFNEHNKQDKFCKICGSKIIFDNKTIFCSDKCKKINKFYKTLNKYFNLSLENIGSLKFLEDIKDIKNKLNKLYWEDNLSFSEISKIFNYPYPGNLSKIFNYLELDARTFSECSTNAYLTYNRKQSEQHNQYKSGWHNTWNNKKIYFRSTYELDFAKYLDKNKIDYDVESLHIQYYDSKLNKLRIAIPDFYLKETNTIVEIKSSWTLDKQNMLDRYKKFIELGYNFKLILNKENIENVNEFLIT